MAETSENRKVTVVRFILAELKGRTGEYAYDIAVPDTVPEGHSVWRCAVEILKGEPPPPYTPPNSSFGRTVVWSGEESRETKTAQEIFPLFQDALWQLCLTGVLRPGIRFAGAQPLSMGTGYSLTMRGRKWVLSFTEEDVQELVAKV